MKVLSVIAVVGLAVASVEGSALRESVQNALEAETQKNPPFCLCNWNKWWSVRTADKTRTDITTLDATCAQFSDDPTLCNEKTSRSSSMSKSDQNAACTMVGAHSKRCIANPCNHYNTGDCTLSNTGGVCVWWTTAMVNKINAYYKENNVLDYTGNVKQIKGHGCYRNPCNMPGYGNSPKKECNAGTGDFSVPGVYRCHWCDGEGVLKGSGMGCQMEMFNGVEFTSDVCDSTAECAPVNTPSVQNSVYYRNNNFNCQCSNDYTYCELAVSERGGEYTKKG